LVARELQLPPLSAQHREWLVEALDTDNDAPDLTGFERAIHLIVIKLAGAGPLARDVTAEIEDFVANHLRPFARAYVDLSEAAREELRDGWRWEDDVSTPFYADFERAITDAVLAFPRIAAATAKEQLDPQRFAVDVFLHEVIGLAQAAGADAALPSRSSYSRAREFPIFVTVNTAIEIALAIAEHHAPVAVSELKHLDQLADATLVDRLHQVRRDPMLLAVSG
jgi:hypothetical protein